MKVSLAVLLVTLLGCSSAEHERTALLDSSAKSKSITEKVEEKREISRACFLSAFNHLSEAEKRSQKSGTIKIGWLIQSNGSVKNDPKVILDTFQLPGVAECLVKTIQGIRFDPIADAGTIEVAYPFRFTVSQ